ncbi:conjugal transfer protein TraQ [Klebsiella quasipneumoniae]|uniref:conjugal transfer protein TraQ n=1 Tax=Klebsiella quasipneumoniae TaxID=1463165 RepID=UPI0010334AF8|nr:conjugal transfer protein TraQ [Klebsiella quasipneumoniae]
MDAVQALVKFASGLHASIFNLVWVMATLLAITGSITFLTAQIKQARLPHGGGGGGKIVAWILLCAGLAGLQQMIGAGAAQMGWNAVSFDEIAYVSTGSFGAGADAANAVLTLVRALGGVFCLTGWLLFRRSLKDGHTGLTAGQDVAGGWVRFICGILMICNPYLLDALQSSLGLAW